VIHVRYLHGFGSGPGTSKGAALGKRLAGEVASYAIPDLEDGDFPSLTMTAMQARARASVAGLSAGDRVILVGSSLGGYSAALIAAAGLSNLAGAVLIAPAFRFPSLWEQRLGAAGIAQWRRTGALPVFHHGAQRELPLGSAFLDSCIGLPDLPGQAQVPIAIVHGRQDATVDHRGSVDYATGRERVELHLVEGDHRLTEPRHEDLIVWCVRDLIARA
jgi:alpha-beta hydrolase superfamily lysophospholipase